MPSTPYTFPELVAFLGTFKVSLAPEHLEPHWICEIPWIVAARQKDDFEKAFFGPRDQRRKVR